jgi:hypothetical protein
MVMNLKHKQHIYIEVRSKNSKIKGQLILNFIIFLMAKYFILIRKKYEKCYPFIPEFEYKWSPDIYRD